MMSKQISNHWFRKELRAGRLTRDGLRQASSRWTASDKRADLAAEQIDALRHERNVLQKICAERSDDLERLEAAQRDLAKSLNRLLWLREDDQHGQTPVASEYEWDEAWEVASEALTKIDAQRGEKDDG